MSKTRIIILGLGVVLLLIILLGKRIFKRDEVALSPLPELPPIILPALSVPSPEPTPAKPAPVAPVEKKTTVKRESPPPSPVTPKIEEQVRRPDMKNIPMFTNRKDLLGESSS
jgi:hypothetical protein